MNIYLDDEKADKKNILGQVFTPDNVAQIMVEILSKYKPNTILDPCFGEGIFINKIKENLELFDEDMKIVGVEVDKKLYESFSEKEVKNISIYNKSFFDIYEKVDSIIMNPPYIRQELLTNNKFDFLNKRKIINSINELGVNVSSRSNMYIYFIIKAWSLLKDNGSIIAIIPNTWMTSEYGQSFKQFILNNFIINDMITFNKDVFNNADVESCILNLQKKSNENFECKDTKLILLEYNEESEIKKINYGVVSEDDLRNSDNWMNLFCSDDVKFKLDNFIKLKKICEIRRGITTNSNEFFIDDAREYVNKYREYFKEIICSPKDIDGFSTDMINKTNYILNIKNEKDSLPKELKDYVLSHEINILNKQKPVYLYNKIIKNKNNWYCINDKEYSDIIFSYIIRKNKQFILNNKCLIRDNFYEMTLNEKSNVYVLLAILNSSITSYFLEKTGRRHGKGVLKIQKYELDNLSIINPSILSDDDKIQLLKLGKKLSNVSKQNSDKIIKDIDSILIKYSCEIDINEFKSKLIEKEEVRIDS